MNVCKLVYNEIRSDNNLKYFVKLGFEKCQSIHDHETRSSCKDNLFLNVHRTNYYSRSVKHKGSVLYNLIPNEIKKSSSVFAFKRNLKKWLMNSDFDF